LSAMDALSYTRTFTEMCIFLEKNYQYFRGAEVAAVVLQAANVAELATHRQVAAAMSVAERRSSELAARGEGGGLNAEMLAGAVEEVLSAAGPGTGSGTNDDTVLDELDAADQLMAWATPLLRAHIKRYPSDAVSALLASLAQLQQYDRRLMEMVAENFKSDPQDWLRRASPAAGSGDDAAYEGPYSSTSSAGADPWFTLVSLAGAYARLGHYDRDLMSEIAKLAVKMMPMISERADAEDVAAAAAIDATDGIGIGDSSSPGFSMTDTVVALVSSFFELNHLDPPLMQAAGEHLAAFSHQLDQGALSEAILAFASFNARNPPFYSHMLRRLLEAVATTSMATTQGATQGGSSDGGFDRSGGAAAVARGLPGALSPRAAGALYRACVLLTDMGDVPELAMLALHHQNGSSSGRSNDVLTASVAAAAAGTASVAAEEAEEAEARYVGRQLSLLLRECLLAYPLSSLHAASLGRPTPQQLEQASAVPELLEAWEVTGLLTVPQIISALQQLPGVEPLPPSSLAMSTTTGHSYANRSSGGGGGGDDDDDEDDDGAVVGGADAVAWVPPDALLLYDPYGSRSGSVPRVAIKALDEKIHCCRNVGTDPDLEPDRPGPRSGSGMNTRSGSWSPSPSRGGLTTPQRNGHRLFRLRGPAVSELRCLEVWGWKVLMVPVGIWGAMDPAGRRTWLLQKLDEIAAEAEADAVGGASVRG
ncbi:hypothetical protein Vafri_8033, partial [Volvox africanus]